MIRPTTHLPDTTRHDPAVSRLETVGGVVIGRNEGERLRRCLASLRNRVRRVVYVDSGSSDDSLALARAMGAEVVELDSAQPFTAARARNAGIARLIELEPGVRWVQVVDGDCELAPGWLETAARRLARDETLAVVCGRRRERYPHASLFNRLMDMEWDTPVGEAAACGGDAMLRITAWQAVGGYDPSLICGEEPELCVRLRQQGYRIERLDHEMTRHDAAMTQWRQWWRRSERGGWAYAQGAAMHGRSPDRHNVRRSRSVWLWGLLVPAAALLLARPTRGLSLLALLAYPVLMGRVYRHRRRERRDASRHALLYAVLCVLGKFPEAVGQLRYTWHRMRGGPARLIEYKQADASRHSQGSQR